MKQLIDAPFEVKEVTDKGSFVGLGSMFGNVDYGGDTVEKGAFRQSLSEWASKGRMPALLWQHKQHEPIGAYQSMCETPNGLEVSGTFALKTQRGAEAYELMKMGALSGLSIGGYTKADDYNAKSGVRTIKQFDLQEVSVVTFPMNDGARVAAVKGIEEIGDLSGAEAYLRDAGGLSRSEAKALISRVKALSQRDAGADQSEEIKLACALLEKRRAILA